MVQHKSVHFHCHDGKAGRTAEKFQEPAEMTSIDLKSIHELEEERQEEVHPPVITSKSIQKYIVKSLVIGTLIIFGIVTFLSILPPQGIKSWRNILHLSKNSSDEISPSQLMKLISTYTEKIDHCKETRNVNDCCTILADLYDGFAIETCNIDTIRSLVSQFDGNVTNLDEESGNNNITLDKYQYNNEEDSRFKSNILISKLSTPFITDGTFQVQGDNVAIILSNGRIIEKRRKFIKKRQALFEPLPYYPNNQEMNYLPMEYYEQPPMVLNDPPIYHQLPPQIHNNIDDNQLYQQPYFSPQDVENNEQEYRIFTQDSPQLLQTTKESKERKFKFVDSKQRQPVSTNQDNSKSNPIIASNSIVSSTQCIPYTFPPTYDPSPRYADMQLLPINRNPYMMNPTYPYSVNPTYFPMAQYQYNPFYLHQNTAPTSIQATGPSGQFFICNPVPAPTSNHLTSIPGVEVRHSSGLNLQDMMGDIKELHSNKTRDSDLCPSGELLCGDELKCVKEFKICDNEVDCKDASDEVDCSCTDRIGPSRLCDGYYDCPNGEDEWNCFGCKKNTFSCDDWSDNRKATCIPIEKRCDGIVQCKTGKDENDCSILSETFGKSLPVYKISNSAGYLYRNYKGKWYPACSNSEMWATSACEKEVGPNILPPIIRMVPTHKKYEGQYVNALTNNEIGIVESCVPDFASYVQCPSPVCGKRMMGKRPFHSEDVDDSGEDSVSRFRWKRSNETVKEELLGDSRVVGGIPSRPAAWPWVVSIYRNGFFHCGGVIITETWILTAAHCVDKFSKYYFEVEAGILRRLSYSPMQQTRFVTHVICHDAYDRAVLKNDLGMLKIDSPLKFNRHIRPICLPSEATAGKNFLNGPPPGTLCTAIGWGATFEHGPDPDHLREVEIPVLKHCKYPEDQDGQEICAGFVEGGKDACQGDSGGPFMCRNPNSPDQWYLAGIVSHGDGCARPNEPGVYTRVSLYLDWIFENIRSTLIPLNVPLLNCPGYQCKGTRKCLPKKSHCDKIVDCLMGDDERHCGRSKMASLFEQAMRRMIKLGSSLPLGEVNKLGTAKDTIVEAEANTEHTTLIVNGRSPGADERDAITTFKIENTTDQTERGAFATESEIFTAAGTDYLESTANSVTTEIDPKTVTSIAIKSTVRPSNEFFKCTRMLQLIPLSRRCDRFVDCEDGTDEMNCTCLDYLKIFYSDGLCDGISDCADLSDEKDCGATCLDGDFRCWASSTCVKGWKKCDFIQDCPHNEDEWDCFALMDANVLLLDGDLRPHLNTKGVVSFYHDRTWMPLCFDWMDHESTVASDVCLSLNLDDYVNYRRIEVVDGPLKVFTSFPKEDVEANETKENNTCSALYVKCSNRTVTEDRLQDITNADSYLYGLAWNVAVYADGEYKCTGVLLNLNWVLTSLNCFHGISKIHLHYVTVLAGIGRSYMGVKGPHEQLRSIVYSTIVLYSDAVLLRTDKKFSFTRYVRPLTLSARDDAFRNYQQCVAIGVNERQKMETVLLHILKTCTSGSRCFKRIVPPKANCTQKTPWSGVVICESKKNLYPLAVYHEPRGKCGFSQSSPFTVLWLLSKAIADIIYNSTSFVLHPICNGYRCPLGNCVAPKRVCDEIADCRSGEDESERNCKTAFLNNNVCTELDLKCASGKCVHKSAYCDRNNDCGDSSDEPGICNCYNYLNLTQPEQICDGIVNCEDKSDENPKLCNCTDQLFKCDSSNTCVPFEMVCDGEQDCDNGEDEKHCISLRNRAPNATDIQGEVIVRTSGIWHSGCFHDKMSTTELTKICGNLGFKNTTGSYLDVVNQHERVPAPVFKRYDIVWIHMTPKLRLALRSGREPLIDFNHSERCFKLYIKCGENKS